jgi:hypothetical protein
MGEGDDLERLTQEQEEQCDRLQVPLRPQKLDDHVSSSHQATIYDKSDRRSSVTTERDSIDDYPIIRVSP